MGFFSQECIECGHPALSIMACNKVNAWMNDVVVVTPDDDIHTGEYDGYGRVGYAEYAVGDKNTVYHKACWIKAGKPMTYRGESKRAEDQGWFFDDPDHNMKEPRA